MNNDIYYSRRITIPTGLGLHLAVLLAGETYSTLTSTEKVPATQEPPAPLVRGAKCGRNEPCPCGSGKKYKRCCR